FGDPLGGRKAMAFFLGQSADAGELVAVQSIGHVTAAPWDGDPDQYKQDMITAWTTITDQIARDGANPNTFYTANGSYAYLGGPRLARSEGQDSSSAVVLDPTTSPPISESGTLHGRVVVGADGMLKPVLTEAGGGGLDLQLYDKLFTAPRPWRCTPPSYGPQPPAADCAAALAYITANVGEFGPGWGNDLRQAYWKNLGIDYGAAKSDLSNLRYPADNRNCNEPKGPHVAPNPGYTRREFCGLVSELQGEFTWMANVNTLFNNYKDALSRSVAQQLIDLKSIGNTIEGDVAPDNAAETTWSVFGFLGNATSAALVFAAATPEGTAALAAWEALVSIYEFIREMISQNQGQPVGDQVASKAQDLASDVASRLGATSDALDRLHQVIASDYGRLSSIGSVASSPAWTVDVPAAKEKLLVAAHQFFYSQLMPIPYGVHDLVGAYPHYDDNPDNCYVYGYGWTFYKAPATAKMKWFGDFNVDGVGGGFPSQFVLGRHSLSVRYYAYPPQSLTDAMFLAPSQQGAGMQLSRYIWNSFDSPHPPTDIAYCH
ncbi:MAG: hypothetical protein ACXVH3_34645, partial [Solirubrobacteraceae bacterium]